MNSLKLKKEKASRVVRNADVYLFPIIDQANGLTNSEGIAYTYYCNGKGFPSVAGAGGAGVTNKNNQLLKIPTIKLWQLPV